MKHIAILTTLILLLLFNACSNKTAEYLTMGEKAYTSDNYELALLNWEKVIKLNKNTDPEIFAKAGNAALELKQYSKATDYLTKAYEKGLKTPEVLSNLASLYKKSDNLSYEITYLQKLINDHADHPDIQSYKERLFDAYVRSENWEKADALWGDLGEKSQKNLATLINYFTVQRALKNNDKCVELSRIILKKDAGNADALEYQAKHYYHKGEALYQREMASYNAKKTRAQYAKLLKALKLATADFKTSRDYFERLYDISQEKSHAKFLSNIYARLNNQQKSDYYKNLSKQ